MDWIVLLNTLTIVNKVLFFLLFWFKKNNSIANKVLALFILLPAVATTANLLWYLGVIEQASPSFAVTQIVTFLFPPVLLWYCESMMGKTFKWTYKTNLHLIPLALPIYLLFESLIFNSTNYSFLSFNIWAKSTYINTWRDQAIGLGLLLQLTPYLIYIFWITNKHEKKVKDTFSDIENLKVRWVKEFAWTILIMDILAFVICIIAPEHVAFLIAIPILSNAFYFYIVYKCFNHAVIFSDQEFKKYAYLFVPLQNIENEERSKVKYQTSSLTEEKLKQYAAQIEMGFTKEKYYLDAELNLKTLSEKMNIAPHHISQTLNQVFHKNFFDFVNSYRVEDLKYKLLDPSLKHIKFEELSYMSGFNSKAAYMRAFKKHTGLTLSEFKETQAVQI